MIAITEGMTPSEFISALNYNYGTVDGISLLAIASTLSDINDNTDIVNTEYPTASLGQVSAGMGGASYISSLNQNFANTKTATWWDVLWLYRTPLRFNASTITVNTDNCAIRVHIDKTTFDYSKFKTAGADIRFTDKDGTELDYEIEYWTDTEGSEDAVCWVLVPRITAVSTYIDMIYLYYGNAAAVDNQDKNALWLAANVIAVWHFAEGEGATVFDSSVTGADGTILNPSGDWIKASGVSAIELNHDHIGEDHPGNEIITCGNPTVITEMTGDISIAVWYKLTSYTNGDMDFLNTNYNRAEFFQNFSVTVAAGSDQRVYLALGDGVPTGPGRVDGFILTEWGVTNMPLNIWHSFIGKLDGNYLKCAMDGDNSLQNPPEQLFDANSGTRQTGERLAIGGWGDGDTRALCGFLDEIKIFNRSLSRDEERIDTLNRLNTFLNYMEREEA